MGALKQAKEGSFRVLPSPKCPSKTIQSLHSQQKAKGWVAMSKFPMQSLGSFPGEVAVGQWGEEADIGENGEDTPDLGPSTHAVCESSM